MPLNFPLLKAQYSNKMKNPMDPTVPGGVAPPAIPAPIAPPVAPGAAMPKAQSFSHMADMIKKANPGHNGTLDKVQSDLAKKQSMKQKFADSMRQRNVEALRGIVKGGK
jgi:hypothetical protein